MECRMPTYMATDYEPVPPGLYTARLEKIEEATSQHGTYYRWQFVIEEEGEHEDRKVFANVSDKFGPQSKARWVCPVSTDRLPLSHGASSQSNLFVFRGA
jgi:hypothetical protein